MILQREGGIALAMPEEILDIINAKAGEEDLHAKRNGKLRMSSMRSKIIDFGNDDDDEQDGDDAEMQAILNLVPERIVPLDLGPDRDFDENASDIVYTSDADKDSDGNISCETVNPETVNLSFEPENSDTDVELSLIHISEPTRPY